MCLSATYKLSEASTTIPAGSLNSASVPAPSTYPQFPVPANASLDASFELGSKVIFLIFPWSETNKFPAESNAIPLIWPNWVSVLLPFWSPYPSPITLVTFPEESIFDILCLPSSNTNISPAELNANNLGLANPTSVFKPSSLSCAQFPFPAYVDTTPAEVIFLITLFSLSATNMSVPSETIELGWLNAAKIPVPSE